MALLVSPAAGPGELLARVARGDPDGLTAVYDRHGPALYQLALRLTGSPDDAEDVLQDVFVGLPEALRRYEERGNFAGWLSRVTARTALMRLRADRRRRSAAEHATIGDSNSHRSTPGDALGVRMTLDSALRGLSEHERTVFVLKELEGYTHAEIAEMLSISRRASEVRLFRAIRRLRVLLEDSL